MNRFPCLETEAFVAYIADNSPLGIHCAGYNGVASLIPKHSGNNLFVPLYAGLNYETISLAGLPPYRHASGSKFEPRCEPMHIEQAGKTQVVLVQPETSYAHVSARITFSVEEPCYLHQRIELTFHRKFCGEQEKNVFHSLWASYIHMPPDLHLYMKLDPDSPDLHGWIGVTKEDHSSPDLQVRGLPEDREVAAEEHLSIMKTQPPLNQQVCSQEWAPMELPKALHGPLMFYYGLCHDAQLFLMMFQQPDRFRLAYSPCGAGKQPVWNPAWDYVLVLEDAQLEKTYGWDLCLAAKRYEGRADVLNEVRRYRRSGESPDPV